RRRLTRGQRHAGRGVHVLLYRNVNRTVAVDRRRRIGIRSRDRQRLRQRALRLVERLQEQCDRVWDRRYEAHAAVRRFSADDRVGQRWEQRIGEDTPTDIHHVLVVRVDEDPGRLIARQRLTDHEPGRPCDAVIARGKEQDLAAQLFWIRLVETDKCGVDMAIGAG